MAQPQVDEWCDELAKVHYVQVSDTHYAAIPREVRGVPHYTVPGLHAYLDDYENGLERARGLIGVAQGHWTVDSLQCLPFGPYTERLAPHVAESSGVLQTQNLNTRAHFTVRNHSSNTRGNDHNCFMLRSIFRWKLSMSLRAHSHESSSLMDAHCLGQMDFNANHCSCVKMFRSFAWLFSTAH